MRPVRARPGRETSSAGALNRSSNCAATASERSLRSISKNRLRLHASRLHVPASSSSPSRTNAFAWSIAGYSRIRTPASSSVRWWNCCAAAHAQLFAFAGTKRRTATPRRAACSMRRIIPRSVTYGLTTSRVSRAPSSAAAIASVIGR